MNWTVHWQSSAVGNCMIYMHNQVKWFSFGSHLNSIWNRALTNISLSGDFIQLYLVSLTQKFMSANEIIRLHRGDVQCYEPLYQITFPCFFYDRTWHTNLWVFKKVYDRIINLNMFFFSHSLWARLSFSNALWHPSLACYN